MIELELEEERDQHIPIAKIKVAGIGGAGGNTVDCMKRSAYKGVEFIAINTDAQALKLSKADIVIHIGQKSTKGLGAGANPEVGKRAAEEDLDKVLQVIGDADIVFLTGGMGGGTGSGALPAIVQALREKGILTIVVITKPFGFEGRRRAQIAEEAIKKIREFADTVIIIPNQKLLDLVDDKVSMIEGFEMINEVLNQSVKGISDIITRAGHINVDFADVREIMRGQGLAVMGTGRASGEQRAKKAALEAISSPLLENMSIAGARGVLLNITGSSSLGLHEISAAASVIYEQADENANIILGSVIDDSLGEEIAVTVIATGFVGCTTSDVQVKATILAKDKAQEMHHVPHANPAYTPTHTYEASTSYRPQPVPAQSVYYQESAPVYRQEAPTQQVSYNAAPQVACQVSPQMSQQATVQAAPQVVAQPAYKEQQYVQYEPHHAQVQSREEIRNVQHEQELLASLVVAENESQHSPAKNDAYKHEKRDSGLGSNTIQLRDLDVPTFMRKQQQDYQRQQPQGQRAEGNRQENRSENRQERREKERHHGKGSQHQGPYSK